MNASAETEITTLYQNLLNAWNDRSAATFAALFAANATSIGFDGSQMHGPAEIESTLSKIFTDHPTAQYVHKVREVRLLSTESALLRAIVGMVPRGQSDINPATNAFQTIVAVRENNEWKITLLQNTPAQFHGRPELVQQMTDELRQLLK